MQPCSILSSGSGQEVSYIKCSGRLVLMRDCVQDTYFSLLFLLEYAKLIFIILFALIYNNQENSANKLVCSNTYSGPKAGSEQETQAIMKYFMEIRPVLGAIDYHSYSQAVLYPYGKLTCIIIKLHMHIGYNIHDRACR